MSLEQELFTSQVARGEIPTRSVRRLHSGLPSTKFIAPYQAPGISSTPIPFWSILQMEDDIFNVALHSTRRMCTHCSSIFPITCDVSTLQSAILQDWSDQFARIYFGGPQEVREWAASQGLQTQRTSPLFDRIGDAIPVDATSVTPDALLRLREILAGGLRLPGSTVWVSDSIRTTAYSANGFCVVCGIDGEPLTRVTLRSRLNTELNENTLNSDSCLSRLIGDKTLTFLLNTPFSTLRSASPLPISSLADALTQVQLGELSLFSTSDEVGESGCALAYIASELSRDASPAVTILDAPFCGMSYADAHSLALFLNSQSTSRLLVVFGAGPTCETDEKLAAKVKASTILESPWLTLKVGASPSSTEIVVSIGETPITIFSAARNRSTPFLRSLRALPPDLGTPQVEVIDPHRRSTTSLVVDDLGWYEGFCKIFAASHAARVNGFTPQAFKRTTTRSDALVCRGCKGFGVFLERIDHSIINSGPCPTCQGHRFADKVAQIQFRGRTVWEVLSGSVEANRALIRTIPRATPLLNLIEIVGLTYLPLGLPSELLTESERILLQCAVAAIPPSNGSRRLVFCRHPLSTLSSREWWALLRLVDSTDSKKVRWCFESDDPGLIPRKRLPTIPQPPPHKV